MFYTENERFQQLKCLRWPSFRANQDPIEFTQVASFENSNLESSIAICYRIFRITDIRFRMNTPVNTLTHQMYNISIIKHEHSFFPKHFTPLNSIYYNFNRAHFLFFCLYCFFLVFRSFYLSFAWISQRLNLFFLSSVKNTFVCVSDCLLIILPLRYIALAKMEKGAKTYSVFNNGVLSLNF